MRVPELRMAVRLAGKKFDKYRPEPTISRSVNKSFNGKELTPTMMAMRRVPAFLHRKQMPGI
jgi:hypothetical protein